MDPGKAIPLVGAMWNPLRVCNVTFVVWGIRFPMEDFKAGNGDLIRADLQADDRDLSAAPDGLV